MARLLKKENIATKEKKKSIQELANEFYMTRSVDSYQRLYDRVHWGLRTYICKYIKNNIDDCNDVVVNVLEKVWTKIDMYNPTRANFSTWLYRVARNEALLFVQGRTKTNSKIYDNDISDIYTTTLSANGCEAFMVNDTYNISLTGENKKTYGEIVDEMYDVSVTCINKLPDNFRLALTEKLINKKTIEQIAYDNQIKKTTLVNWLYQGKQALKEIVKEEFKDLYEDYTMGEEKYIMEQ